ncbi:Inner membrane symporter yicJ [Raoultella ornithinolytica]|nr:Inner membrane symporter yicJ [Raoultella ornithinolytica]
MFAPSLAQRTQDDSLTLREKIGYGLGDAGGTVITCLIMNFLTFFYTDVFGLTPALVGTLFLALRVFDAISDPIMACWPTAPKAAGDAFARGSYG